MIDFIGLVGGAFIVLAWIPQYHDLFSKPHSKLSLKYGLIYCVGSLLLFIHSISLQDIVFIIFNLLATLLSLFSLIFAKLKHKLY